MNLIINAVHAMQSIPGRAHELSISSSTNARGDAVLTVSDTGTGIPELVRERIFEPFFTTKPAGQGSGLGLAVSRSIIQNQGGDLSVAEGPSLSGTTFTVTLPPARHGAVSPALKVWWVGPRTADTEVLERSGRCQVLSGSQASLDGAIAGGLPEVVLIAVPEKEARRLRQALPDLEVRSLRVDPTGSTSGVVTLRPGFDLDSLTAFVRRGRIGQN